MGHRKRLGKREDAGHQAKRKRGDDPGAGAAARGPKQRKQRGNRERDEEEPGEIAEFAGKRRRPEPAE